MSRTGAYGHVVIGEERLAVVKSMVEIQGSRSPGSDA